MEERPRSEETPRTGLRPASRGPWILVGVAVLAVAAFLWLRRDQAPPPPAPPAPVADAGAPEAAAPTSPAAPSAAGPERPPIEAVSEHPLYRKGLAEGDLERRWAVVTDNLAEGTSPRKQLQFLAPSKPFSVLERGGRTVISPESYRRYDAFADAIASVDVGMLLRAYRGMHGALEAAYRALGYPGASLDRVTVRALRRIVATPVRDGEVPVERSGPLYVFADPRLEELGAVEKHLLRMGPRNTRLVQAKARELLELMK
jgi:hypothetical protein